MLENIAEYYKKVDEKTKKKILACILSIKLVLKKGKDASYKCTNPAQVHLNAARFSKKSDTKKEVENDLLPFVAPLIAGSCKLIYKRVHIFSHSMNDSL